MVPASAAVSISASVPSSEPVISSAATSSSKVPALISVSVSTTSAANATSEKITACADPSAPLRSVFFQDVDWSAGEDHYKLLCARIELTIERAALLHQRNHMQEVLIKYSPRIYILIASFHIRILIFIFWH